jgi:hypothetical protein
VETSTDLMKACSVLLNFSTSSSLAFLGGGAAYLVEDGGG